MAGVYWLVGLPETRRLQNLLFLAGHIYIPFDRTIIFATPSSLSQEEAQLEPEREGRIPGDLL